MNVMQSPSWHGVLNATLDLPEYKAEKAMASLKKMARTEG